MNSLPTVPSLSSPNAASETSELSFEDQAALARAMRELERTSLAIRLSAIVGRQVSAIGSIIPANISEIANKAAEAAAASTHVQRSLGIPRSQVFGRLVSQACS
jgi:hypothetical protein